MGLQKMKSERRNNETESDNSFLGFDLSLVYSFGLLSPWIMESLLILEQGILNILLIYSYFNY